MKKNAKLVGGSAEWQIEKDRREIINSASARIAGWEKLHGFDMPVATYATALPLSSAADAKPVAWRVNDWADGWILFHDLPSAERECADDSRTPQPLYVKEAKAALKPVSA